MYQLLKRFLLLLVLLPIVSAVAQTHPRKLTPTYYFNGGVGAFLPTYNRQGLSLAALSNVFNFEMAVGNHLFTRLAVDLVNVPYLETGIVGGFAVNKKDRLGLSHVGLDVGYRHDRGKTGLYGFLGAGWVSVDVPRLTINVPARQIDFESVSRSFLNLRGGVGVDYRISKVFIPYVELCYAQIPYTTLLNNQPISGLNVVIGFRTPFQ